MVSALQCYMAVTGVPTPRDDHAVLLVKFARACLTRMSQILPTLTSSLGESTMDLAMRIGIHSGPVTAGVLRGEKSRFQLFGDTVVSEQDTCVFCSSPPLQNTASRMESTGQPGRIHISESTANDIVKHGKAKWLTPREDKIVAKGKGEMKTFWIKFSRVSSMGTSEPCSCETADLTIDA